MHRMIIGIVFALVTVAVRPAEGLTIRYALIVGNNTGVDETGKAPFPPLLHAEREAERLKESLVGLSNFDASNARTRLLLDATVDEVKSAFLRIAAQMKRDKRLFGKMDSIFLLYFTGHGLSGRLLLKDAPLDAKALTDLFNQVGADFSVGIFDACYAGSLSGTLMEKGIRATPGVNMIRDLPSEVLSAKGSVWYVSSGAGQPSYEDDALGGVFTHFFIEGLRKAEPEGPGITLDRVWQYARRNTTSYTAARRRAQVPEEIVAKLRAKAPIYFSFPVKRSASLALSEAVEGSFAISYADGRLTEIFEKKRGRPREFAVYPGSAELTWLGPKGNVLARRTYSLDEGDRLAVHLVPETIPAPSLGERTTSLFTKGVGVKTQVTAEKTSPGPSLLVGAGYTFSYAAPEMLHPHHRFSIPLRLDVRRWLLCAEPRFGMDKRTYPAWSYTVKEAGGSFSVGYGFDLGILRLSPAVSIFVAGIWQEFQTGDEKSGFEAHPTVGAKLLFPRKGPAYVEISFDLGPLYAPGSGLDSEASWYLAGGAGLAIYFRAL